MKSCPLAKYQPTKPTKMFTTLVAKLLSTNDGDVAKTINDLRVLWGNLDDLDEEAIVDDLWAVGERYACEAMTIFGWENK